MLSRNNGYLENLAKLIVELKQEIKTCPSCFRFFPTDAARSSLCLLCGDKSRDATSLMIVARDVDFEVIEKSHSYNGFYFILGGTVPILEKEPEKKIRSKELAARARARAAEGLKEIILATSLNPEGENTADFVTRLLSPITTEFGIKLSVLGRGLSSSGFFVCI